MGNRTPTYVRRNGVYYTPSLLARTLVEPLITNLDLTVFDPAYGDGALILAAEQVLTDRYQSKETSNLYGCDLSPISDRIQHLPASNFAKSDFLDYDADRKYDIVLMNPPYVRHHYLDSNKLKHYQDVIRNVFPLKRTSDLWAYFVVKATTHLRENGSIGAILPWSFLHADYSVDLRKWLTDLFRDIRILVLGSDLFNESKERVVLVWLKGYGESNKNLSIGIAKNITDHVKYHVISPGYFIRNHVNVAFSNDILAIIEKYKSRYGFSDLGNYGIVSIGVVTGADSFFIKELDELRSIGIGVNDMVPILTSSYELSGFSVNGNVPSKRLILMNKDNAANFKAYIKSGEYERYHLRSHSLQRDPWYEVKVGSIPDAFFPYRVSLIPYLVLNSGNIQCTNSIHRIYFKDISNLEKKWIQISLLSIPGQLSIEANSRVYGSGVLKIEPSSLKRAILYSSNERSIVGVHNKISKMLHSNNRIEAMMVATEFMIESLGIDRQLSVQARAAYEELLSRRKKKGWLGDTMSLVGSRHRSGRIPLIS